MFPSSSGEGQRMLRELSFILRYRRAERIKERLREHKSYPPSILKLYRKTPGKGLTVEKLLVAIDFARDRVKAEEELQIATSKVTIVQNCATILENRILDLKKQESELLCGKPPPSKLQSIRLLH
jgi:hypothetical protein